LYAGLPVTEPDVALTDYALALECAILTGLLLRSATTQAGLRRLFALFFASSGIAAAAGGTQHGFFLDDGSVMDILLWRAALVALGLTALAAWSIGGRLLFRDGVARAIEVAAGIEWLAYAGVVVFVDHRFKIAIFIS